ncbi:hypothetical protein CVT26_007000 [Gymnopilus dilepis]|uniref:F-box domain-containing protein n=1 Tax=Gymnopilus dilepis TaxID=231916 RepID=A0A409W168_9AGAR|nr:hypothetical protein CVT26_007000 [Gymnopilus dilepis]
MGRSLPLELLEKIMHDVDMDSKEGRSTVSAFACTNHTFAKLGQKILFHDIKIDYIQESKVDLRTQTTTYFYCDADTRVKRSVSGQRFLDLLRKSPHIAPYVYKLTIAIYRWADPPAWHGFFFQPPPPSTPTSEMDSFSLYAIIPQLPNLDCFMGYDPAPTPWQMTEERAQAFFASIIPKFRDLCLFLFQDVPTHLFADCEKLEELTVVSLDPTPPSSPHSLQKPGSGKANLRFLEVGYRVTATEGVPMAKWFCDPAYPALSLSSLRCLQVLDPGCDGNHLADMLALCSDTLEELDIHLRVPERTPELSSLHKLRKLTIRLQAFGRSALTGRSRGDQSQLNPFPHALATLRTLPLATFLPQQLYLNVVLRLISLDNFNNALPRLPGWSDLTRYLNEDPTKIALSHTRLELQQRDRFKKPLSVPLPQIVEILDKNAGLRALKEEMRLTYDYALPIELQEQIVDNIDATSQDGQQTLSALSRTSHAFTPYCQRLLFRSVEITYAQSRSGPTRYETRIAPHIIIPPYVIRDGDASEGEPTTGRLFCDLLRTSPHIASYVSSLTVHVSVSRPYDPPSAHTPSSAIDSFSLYTIIPLLSNLSTFVIDSTFPTSWGEMEDRLKGFLASIIATIPRVGLFLFRSMPTTLFSDCTRLEDLSTFPLDPALPAPTPVPTPATVAEHPGSESKAHLRVLRVSHDPKLADWFRGLHPWPASLSLSHLRSLRVFDFMQGNRLNDLLSLCSSTLEELDIHLRWSPHTTPSLASLHHLRRLTLRLSAMGPFSNIPISQDYMWNPCLYAIPTLRTLPAGPTELYLTIHVVVMTLSQFNDVVPVIPAWSNLAGYLNEDTAVRFIRHTRLVVQRGMGSGVKPKPVQLMELANILDKNTDLRALREAGRLSYGSE